MINLDISTPGSARDSLLKLLGCTDSEMTNNKLFLEGRAMQRIQEQTVINDKFFQKVLLQRMRNRKREDVGGQTTCEIFVAGELSTERINPVRLINTSSLRQCRQMTALSKHVPNFINNVTNFDKMNISISKE